MNCPAIGGLDLIVAGAGGEGVSEQAAPLLLGRQRGPHSQGF
jgi:hypothetical protein